MRNTGLQRIQSIFTSQPEWFWGCVAVVWILLNSTSQFQLDEERFVYYADNLKQGFYAPTDTKFLWNGPGLPLILWPFRIFDLPLNYAKLLNALEFFAALRILRQALSRHEGEFKATSWMWGFGGYVFLFGFSWMHLLMTETLAFLCISVLIVAWEKLLQTPQIPFSMQWKWYGIGGFAAGYLALTRFFFGYTLAFGFLMALFILLLGWSLRRIEFSNAKTILRVGTTLAWTQGLGFLICLPYLTYTYQLTGKLFYWGNTGGSQFYTLTLPEPHLLGDVIPMDRVEEMPSISPTAYTLLNSMRDQDEVVRDIAYRKAALENIRSHPKKVFQNWRANCTRLVFDFPFSHFPTSHTQQRTGNLAFLFAFWFYFAVVSLWKFPTQWRHLNAWEWMSIALTCLCLGALSLVSAYSRFVFPILPAILIGLVPMWRRRPELP